MRSVILLAMVSLLIACTVPTPRAPREFLDEQTTATITVPAEPMILVGESSGPARRDIERNRDYLEIYGIDVNRMGDHRQYFAVMAWFAPSGAAGVAPELTLHLGDETIELQAATEEPMTLGISQPLAASYSRASTWWYFPTDTATLKKVAASSQLHASLTTPEQRRAYVIFDDGRPQLAELASALN